MFPFLHATLFSHEPVVIQDYEPWMYLQALPKEDLTVAPREDLTVAPREDLKVAPREQPKNFAVPRGSDALFWCLYALLPDAPPLTKHVEVHQKMSLVKWVSNNRVDVLAATKLSATKLQEYTADVMSNAKTTWGALYLWCHYYKLNVRVVGNVLFMDFVGNAADQETKSVIFHENQTFRHGAGQAADEKWQVDFRQATPLKAIGNYKLDELKQFAASLNLAHDKTFKKKDWYEAVYKALVW